MVFDTSSHLFPQNVIAIWDSIHHLSVIVHGNAVGKQCVNYDHYTNIITLYCNANLSEINQVINDRNVLEKDLLGVWILKAIIKVSPLAQLTINHTDTSWLKITNKNNTEPNFIDVSGALKVDGIKITSWDLSSKNFIRQNVNGSIPRPYIKILGSSESANISNSEVAFLGYASKAGGTNGFLYYRGGNGSSILNNTFHDMWDGFYSEAVASVTIKNNKYYNNLRYGIDLHPGSHDLNITGNLVYDNHKIGIICSQHCYNILVSNNVVHNNRVAGLMFSLDTHNSIARNNYAYHEKIGISIYHSSNDKVYNNLVISSDVGIYAAGSSFDNQIYNNTLMNGNIGIYAAGSSFDNQIYNNTLMNGNIGIYSNLANNIENNLFILNIQNFIAAKGNQAHVSITITNPPTQEQTVLNRSIVINGTASVNGGSGIQIVEAYVAKMPFNGTGENRLTSEYRLTTPVADGNWSRWSLPIILNNTGSYLVRARVTDNAGDQNWAEMTIHLPAYIPARIYNKTVAFVEPTFTYAAYRSGGFYDFYQKYSGKDSANKTITTDLNLLKDRPIPHGPFPYFSHPQKLDVPYLDYFNLLLQHVKEDVTSVTNLTDVDAHEGKIFQPDGRNAYDVLFLFHNEYETQAEYNNLRQFVSNGGTIVFTEANVLFAEVSYDKTNDSISLVKGHYWKLDSKGATPSVSERWLNENREWMGSNFFDVDSNEKVKFRNNPFHYTHTEEQYVTNPLAKIMINYEAHNIPTKYPRQFHNPTIATYEMNYLDGRVINLGIWGHVVEDNKVFLKYLDNEIIPLALGPPGNSTSI
jgi:hypothetical protein